MSIHTILSQQRKEFEKLNVCCPLCGWRTGLVYHECHVCRGFIGNVFNWYLSFATRIMEEVGKELIGSDEEITIESVRLDDGSYDVTEELSESRNNLRAEMRTKLQKMKGDL